MTDTSTTLGVHSEVGQLRLVLVCAPGHAHQRLMPSDLRAACVASTGLATGTIAV